MKLPIDNLSYPVKIIIKDYTGSGFTIKHKNEFYLVTAKHVIYNYNQVSKEYVLIDKKMRISLYPFNNGNVSTIQKIIEFDLESLDSSGDLKSHPSADIVVIKMAEITNIGEVDTINFIDSIKVTGQSDGDIINYDMTNSRKFNEVEITNDIFILGYPVSLSTPEMNQIDYNYPLVRKGIIAGKNYSNKSLILDCPVYGGNSGGLVLEVNTTGLGIGNIHLVGVVVQFVPFVEKWASNKFPEIYNTNLENSGYSVALPVDYIFDLIEEIEN